MLSHRNRELSASRSATCAPCRLKPFGTCVIIPDLCGTSRDCESETGERPLVDPDIMAPLTPDAACLQRLIGLGGGCARWISVWEPDLDALLALRCREYWRWNQGVRESPVPRFPVSTRRSSPPSTQTSTILAVSYQWD